MIKLTSLHTDKRHQLHLKYYTFNKFIERISGDTKSARITEYRQRLPLPSIIDDYATRAGIPTIMPAVQLRRQENGALVMASFNGLITLEVKDLFKEEDLMAVKKEAITVPSTISAFVGATGQEVHILVAVKDAEEYMPQSEAEAEAFYLRAYARMAPIYGAAITTAAIAPLGATLRHEFLLPFDPSPLVNTKVVPFLIPHTAGTPQTADDRQHPLAQPEPERDFRDIDMETYAIYERTYAAAAESAHGHISPAREKYTPDWTQEYLTALCEELCLRRIPLEEGVTHIWNHWKYKDLPWLTMDRVRSIAEAVYAEVRPDLRRTPVPGANGQLMRDIERRMTRHYVFRYNAIMGYTEYRPNTSWAMPWAPVDDRVIHTLTYDLREADVDAWDKDVERYVNSHRVPRYSPIEDYLGDRSGQWDGRDYIGELAATVPTDTPEAWQRWFHTWFLAMVAQWRGLDPRYGNSLVPLLISAQGQHKSAFCRQLLPPQLRSWGYTDHLSLGEERSVHLAMGQLLLINLDEFNRISPERQQGFLKNIIQLPTVKAKRPYGRRTEEIPRLASFIATSNMSDVLTDPSGSRRFIGVQVTGNIDVSQVPNYDQLYAQAMDELDARRPYWLDDAETAEVMEHNRRFQLQMPAEAFFYEYFQPAEADDPQGEWLSAAAIITYIKEHARSSFRVPTTNLMGRILRNIPGLTHKITKNNTFYFVRHQ